MRIYPLATEVTSNLLMQFLCHRFTISLVYVHKAAKKLFPFQTPKHKSLEKDTKVPGYVHIELKCQNGFTTEKQRSFSKHTDTCLTIQIILRYPLMCTIVI